MVSAFNLSLTFLVVCVLASSFATPVYPYNLLNITEPTPTNLENAVKELESNFRESLKSLTQTTEWMLYRIQQIVGEIWDDGLEKLTTWAADVILRMELLTIADGSHYMFPLARKSELETEYKAVAIALSKVLRNLTTMERADALIKEAAGKVAIEHDSDEVRTPEKYFRTIIHEYFQVLDHSFSENSEVGQEYRKQYVEAKEIVKENPNVSAPLFEVGNPSHKIPAISEIKEFLKDKVTFCQAIANKVFLKESVKNVFMIFSRTEHKRFLLARALIKASTVEGYESKTHKVYHQALATVGDLICKGEDSGFGYIANKLFADIDKGLESDPELKKKINVFIKDIEKETAVYGTDMFHLDFTFA